MEESSTFICSICGEGHPLSECTIFDDQELCPQCLEDETLICDACGRRIWNDSNAGDCDTPLCQSCYNYHYTECSRCGAIIRSEDAHYHGDDPEGEEPLCEHCYARSEPHRSINDYYYKPEPLFYGSGSRCFGVELEIDGAGELSSNADRILELANAQRELIYCKHDGSLDDGFEIVTHPMTYAYHVKEMPWAAILSQVISMGYQSHKARTCGLHVHVKKNCNNHPFKGMAGGMPFALAHNGVLHNDRSLRKNLKLPRTCIETDSYIAVQLIEHKKALHPDSLRYMAEQVEGSFTFTVLDGRDNLYFVKGDNPLCLVHFPKTGLYLYASTEEILGRALRKLRLPLEKPVRVEVSCGDILRISHGGAITQSRFDTDHLMQAWYCSMYAPAFPRSRIPAKASASLAEATYVDELKSVAGAFGYAPDLIDHLLNEGFDTDDIEEMLYCGEL